MASSKQEQEITIKTIINFKGISISPSKIKKLVKVILNRSATKETPGNKYEISIAIVGDDEIRKLNKRFKYA